MNRTEKYKEKGVTLIVLVVSIVVLIILSMVSFAMLTGNNGLLKETVSTKQMVDENKIIEHVQSEVLAEKVH